MQLTKEQLLAQLKQYELAVRQAEANYNMAVGAVEAVKGLLTLDSELEREKAIAGAEEGKHDNMETKVGGNSEGGEAEVPVS